MDLYGATKTKYDVPLNHLDFSYIKSCQDKKELEKIVKILRYVRLFLKNVSVFSLVVPRMNVTCHAIDQC